MKWCAWRKKQASGGVTAGQEGLRVLSPQVTTLDASGLSLVVTLQNRPFKGRSRPLNSPSGLGGEEPPEPRGGWGHLSRVG